MFADNFTDVSFTPDVVSYDDPPAILSGMMNLQLDPQGRLITFQAIPPQKQDHPQPGRVPDWSPLFSAAAIDRSTLRPAEPLWATLGDTDVRAAWDGVWPGSSRPMHVEAGAWQGKPVFFSLTGPWTSAERMAPPPQSSAQKASNAIGLSVALCVLFASVALAYRNYRKGRGDRHGAWRIATAVFSVELALFFFRSHLSLVTGSFIVFLIAVATSLLAGSVMWMGYLALEPYIRRNWPQTIVSWTRVLEGRFRDPLVGRDVLYGVLLGITWALLLRTESWLEIRAGDQPPFGDSNYLMGIRSGMGIWLAQMLGAIRTALVFSIILVLLRVLVRNRWLAAALFVVLFAVPKSLGSGHFALNLIVFVFVYGIASISVVRFGVIVLAVGVFTANTLLTLVYSADFSNWYAINSLLVFLSFVAIALWGFRISLGGQRLFREDLFS